MIQEETHLSTYAALWETMFNSFATAAQSTYGILSVDIIPPIFD